MCNSLWVWLGPMFLFVFSSIALGDWPKKTLVRCMSENVFLVVSSRSFMISCLLCKSLSILSLFLCMVRGVSNFIDLHVTIQFSQHHLLKRLDPRLFKTLNWTSAWLGGEVLGDLLRSPQRIHCEMMHASVNHQSWPPLRSKLSERDTLSCYWNLQ